MRARFHPCTQGTHGTHDTACTVRAHTLHGAARHTLLCACTARHGTAWHGTAWHGTAWHSAVRRGPAHQRSTVRQSGTARHNTAGQGKMPCHGTAQHALPRHGHGHGHGHGMPKRARRGAARHGKLRRGTRTQLSPAYHGTGLYSTALPARTVRTARNADTIRLKYTDTPRSCGRRPSHEPAWRWLRSSQLLFAPYYI